MQCCKSQSISFTNENVDYFVVAGLKLCVCAPRRGQEFSPPSLHDVLWGVLVRLSAKRKREQVRQ